MGPTPLHFAAEYGHLEICRLILKHVMALPKTNEGETPLDVAQNRGHEDICDLLRCKFMLEASDGD